MTEEVIAAIWQTANEHYKMYLRATLASKIHTIVTLRSKTEYVLQENDRGKYAPKKVGMAPVMRDGVEFEFTTILDLDMSHQAQASKDRTNLFDDRIFKITEDTGAQIMQWLNEGSGSAESQESPHQPTTAALINGQ